VVSDGGAADGVDGFVETMGGIASSLTGRPDRAAFSWSFRDLIPRANLTRKKQFFFTIHLKAHYQTAPIQMSTQASWKLLYTLE